MNDPQFQPMEFKKKRKRLIQYMLVKISEADWHAVSDAANDLRVLEAEYKAGNERCCENGYFFDGHVCRKQPGTIDNV